MSGDTTALLARLEAVEAHLAELESIEAINRLHPVTGEPLHRG